MKRIICALAALLLLAIFPGLALADGLYDQYGPMDEWSDEAWLASDDWSEEQWEEYYQGKSEAYEKQRQEELRQARLKLGCPDPDNINVKLDKAFLLFPEAKPQRISGGVYLPLRAFFSAIGQKAAFEYDATSRSVTVTSAGGATLFLAVDDHTIIITQPDEEPEENYAYYTPLILDSRIYVAAEDICRFWGWDNYWDYSYQILYIVDPEPLIEAVNKDFSIINSLFKINIEPEMEQSYKFTGNASLSGTLYGDEKNDTVSASLSYEGIRKGLDIDMNFAAQLDLKQMQDSIFSGIDKDTWDVIKAISAAKGRLIMNSDEEAAYLQSNLLPFYDKQLSAKDWLKMDYPVQELYMLLADNIIQEQFNMGRIIYESSGSYSYDERDVYANTLNNAKQWKDLLGDDNFKLSRSGGYDVYSLRFNKKDIPGLGLNLYNLFDYGYDEGESMAELSVQLRFKEKEGQVEDIEIKATFQITGAIPITFTLDYSGSSNKYQCLLEIKGRYLGKLLFNAAYEAKPTADLPAAAPPQGSRVIDEQDTYSSIIYKLLQF